MTETFLPYKSEVVKLMHGAKVTHARFAKNYFTNTILFTIYLVYPSSVDQGFIIIKCIK